MSGRMDCFGITDIGRKRSTNEDQFLIADLNKSMRVHHTSLGLDHQTRLFGNSQGKLLVVADGMGGHEAGERASQLVVDNIVTYVLNTLHWYFRLDIECDEDFCGDLKAALKHCQNMLAREVQAAPQRRGMGTTLTMAYLIWPRMYVLHVGDSRCYVLRDGKLEQITRDHTMSQLHKEAMDAEGEEVDAEDENASRLSNVLWNVIGADDEELHPEVYRVDLETGDVLLLCTDGLTKHVRKPRLVDLLRGMDTSESVCRRMVEEAKREGGTDNITVIVGRLLDTDQACLQDESQAMLPVGHGKSDSLADTDPYPDKDVRRVGE